MFPKKGTTKGWLLVIYRRVCVCVCVVAGLVSMIQVSVNKRCVVVNLLLMQSNDYNIWLVSGVRTYYGPILMHFIYDMVMQPELT
jgi:hypothetical protein